jgi:hypothetical protein
MLQSLNRKYPFPNNLKLNLRAIIGISLGILLFLLFFQPLNPQNPDFNNKLLILSAFGGISLILLVLLRVVIPSFFPTSFSNKKWTLYKEVLLDFIFVVLNSVAYSFFAKFVGKIPINFHIETIIVIISTGSIVVLVLINDFQVLKKQVRLLKANSTPIKEPETKKKNVEINFESENKSEYFRARLDTIVLIKAANNYIEIIHLEGEKTKRRLLRNTLKNTEVLISKYLNLVRCHRSCIVNIDFIEKVGKGSEGIKLKLHHYSEEIHVSRQYSLKVKEALR